ncbi:MAG: long-chain-fatty-acid--CoA ligase, partial [Mycobacterium sp.]|nr:long-chain-fatty-acid--CoA ligase [Mycobacterium sp.]
SEPKVLITESCFLPVVRAVRERDPGRGVQYVVLGELDEIPDWAISFEVWLARGAGRSADRRPTDAGEPFFIGFTSGTTGAPKGALVSHRGLIRNGLSLISEYGAPSERDDRFLTVMPMFHSNSTWFGVSCVMAGATNVIAPGPSFDPEAILATIAAQRITHTSVVPTMLKRLVDLGQERAGAHDLGSMRYFLCGSAPISAALKEQVETYLKCSVNEGYGATETGIVSSLRPGDPPDKKASVGRPVIGMQVEIRDPAGKPLPADTVGEVWVRGESVLLTAYRGRPEATAEALRPDGWCTAGDMGSLDKDGYLFLADRKNDLIISGGENIYPSEVESVVLTHPAVAEAAVVGHPDDDWGEIVRAVVALRPGRQLEVGELQSHCRRDLAGFKIPRIVEFVDELPKSPTGKILRRMVRTGYPSVPEQ